MKEMTANVMWTPTKLGHELESRKGDLKPQGPPLYIYVVFGRFSSLYRFSVSICAFDVLDRRSPETEYDRFNVEDNDIHQDDHLFTFQQRRVWLSLSVTINLEVS